MAPITICNVCCNPLPFANSDITWKSAVLLLLCGMANSSTVTLCDAEGAPVIVRTQYDANGAPIVDSITAYYVDGSPYEGDIADLVACGVGA